MMLSGNNGILNRAGEAKERTEKAQKEEARLLSTMEAATNVTETIFEGVKIPAGYAPTRREGESTVNEGLVITDSQGNEFVWIEVPNDGTGPIYPENATDEQIYNALRKYCEPVILKSGSKYSDLKTTTKGYTDEWYAWDEENSKEIRESNATPEQKELTNGCGLSLSEYNETKHEMLKSIKDNGGFYIGKYETGIDDSSIPENETTTAGLRTASGNTTQKAVIQPNKQPYTYVTCSQAQNLAKGFATGGKRSSLLFGIQWDLVLKFISIKENLGNDNTLLTSNSITWGNYSNNTYNITNPEAWYSTDNGANWTKGAYDKTSEGTVLLTTGAHTNFSKQNIIDLAGNVWELTLEKASWDNMPRSTRGGGLINNGDRYPVSSRNHGYPTSSYGTVGFRVALY